MNKNPLFRFFGDSILRYGQFFDDGSGAVHPVVAKDAFVSPHAVVIGDVRISSKVFVAPNATLRADVGAPFYIGEMSNIQDNVVVHADDERIRHNDEDYAVYIGSRVTLAHQSMVQGPSLVSDRCYIGVGAKIFSSRLGNGCFVSHGAIVHHVTLPSDSFVPIGAIITTREQADALGTIPEERLKRRNEIVDFYLKLGQIYRQMAVSYQDD